MPQGEPPTLRPFGPHDNTVWRRGKTVARCRHDPNHTPPHPGCTCGLYAMTLIDVRYSVACRAWLIDYLRWAVYAEKHGYIAATMFAQRATAEWAAGQPHPVIGEVRLYDPVPMCRDQTTGDGEYLSRSWRARAAVITALYVPAAAADVVDALARRYGVPCEVGYPDGWTRAEWDVRAVRDGQRISPDHPLRYPSHAALGLHPPGA
jgi:phage tail protein X